MRIVITAVVFAFLIGCSKSDSLVFLMETSFSEQFTNACDKNMDCINAVDSFMGPCFRKDLAIAAINAKKEDKKRINSKHILEVQACLSKYSGKDHWKNIDMPKYILSQVK